MIEVNTRPIELRGGTMLQLMVPDGHSRLRLRIGTCWSVRSTQVTLCDLA